MDFKARGVQAYAKCGSDALAQAVPVFGIVAICPLKQGGIQAEIIYKIPSRMLLRVRLLINDIGLT